MKKLLLSLSMLVLIGGPVLAADPVPAYAKGSRTINFEGRFDFEQNDEFMFDLSVGYGYFFFNRVMGKVYLDRTDHGSDENATGLGLGGYYFHPIKGPVSVFAGARTGGAYYDTDGGNTDSYYVSPRLGLETLISPTVGLYAQYYYIVQSENVYYNESDRPDDQDTGLYSGLMIFF